MSITVSVLSVSAGMKNFMAVFHQYRPIRKLSLSGFIGIGRYEKKLIGRTLHIPMYTYSMAWIKAILEIAQFFCWFRYCYSMNLSDNAVLDKTSSSVIFNLGYKS